MIVRTARIVATLYLLSFSHCGLIGRGLALPVNINSLPIRTLSDARLGSTSTTSAPSTPKPLPGRQGHRQWGRQRHPQPHGRRGGAFANANNNASDADTDADCQQPRQAGATIRLCGACSADGHCDAYGNARCPSRGGLQLVLAAAAAAAAAAASASATGRTDDHDDARSAGPDAAASAGTDDERGGRRGHVDHDADQRRGRHAGAGVGLFLADGHADGDGDRAGQAAPAAAQLGSVVGVGGLFVGFALTPLLR
jgi:hypothetical protein